MINSNFTGKMIKPIKSLLSFVNELIVNYRNNLFNEHKIKTYKTVKPMISIGNLSMGGTGKTPLTIFLCELIKGLGFNPTVIGLGYKRKSKGLVSIIKDNPDNTEWNEVGDEMYMIHKKLNVPVYVHEKKYVAALEADNNDSDILILDDGYQHRYLERDLNILILDYRTFNEPFVAPKGYLREPLIEIKRADLIFIPDSIHDVVMLDELDQDRIIRFNFSNSTPYLLDDKSIQLNQDENLLAFCGIANPERFFRSVTIRGSNLNLAMKFPDHHNYSEFDINNIISNALDSNVKTLITTEKDASKILKFADILNENDLKCFVMPVDLQITEGFEILVSKIKNLLKK
jgi:tetraacyldisaccharide 4'-kinase